MASSGREKVAGRLASKRKSGDTATQIFKSDRGMVGEILFQPPTLKL